ncbi:MAG: membrane dipeptidase, partial [Actinomycetota bacterium]|nr:membrane dipeptidase [Actinomycetota bacterium]
GLGAPDLTKVVDNADHIKKLVGSRHLALGSDWDGLIKTPRGLGDASDLPALTEAFLRRGYDEEEVRGILGMNFLEAWEEVARMAD